MAYAVFAWPGIGEPAYQAGQRLVIPVIMGTALYSTAGIAVLYLMDVLSALRGS